jgi:arylsulfatase A-like enzyme/Flp pilus assembly protein TadD
MARRARKAKRRKAPSGKASSPPPQAPKPRLSHRIGILIAAGALAVLFTVVVFWISWEGATSPGEDPASVGTGAQKETPVGTGSDEATARGVVREPGLDVLLITIDTLRADALGSYGNQRAETPWMDRLAREGVRFDDAHAHNVTTLPSHANILSGLYPQEHGVRDNSGFRFPKDVTTLASILKDQGYRTGAFVSAFPLASRFGLDRGFEIYEDSFVDATSRPAFLEQERRGPETVALARSWLAQEEERPYFCWVHLYEPHFPYEPPEPFASRFRDAPYHGDVAATDAALAPLLEPIVTAGADGRTLVVLTSDHGESLGEHGEATHGIFAYEGALEVPLILYQPRLFAARVVSSPARHVDLLPTILDALALPLPGIRGRSLLPAAAGEPEDAASETYFEALSGQLNRGWAPLYGVIQNGSKYIDLPIPELYDLRDDPQESTNLAPTEPERLEGPRKLLESLRSIDPGSVPSPESAEIRNRLLSLGYLSGQPSLARESYTEEDDPKRLIAFDETLREIVGLYAAGDVAGALRRCRELVRRQPNMRMALLELAHLERESGNLDAAVKAVQRAFALQPEDRTALALLVSYLTQAGRADEAVEVSEPHTRLAEPDVEVLLTRGLALARLQRPQEAFTMFQRAREVDPENPMVPVYLGTFYLMGGQREKARASYEEALAMSPDMARAHSSLAIMGAEEGRTDEALAHWRKAVASDPGEYAKLLTIGTGLWSSGRRAEARPLLELFVTSAPRETYREEIDRVRGLLAAGR